MIGCRFGLLQVVVVVVVVKASFKIGSSSSGGCCGWLVVVVGYRNLLMTQTQTLRTFLMTWLAVWVGVVNMFCTLCVRDGISLIRLASSPSSVQAIDDA